MTEQPNLLDDRDDCPPAPPRKRGPCVAALDLGTNNCRLLIAEPRPDGFEVIDSFSRITRLGEGLAQTGSLVEAAMARTLGALRVCRHIMARNRVVLARCVATEACRSALNGPAFIERVAQTTGIRLEVLSHEEEAGLAMLGCLPLIDAAARHLFMIDIGGGSTELLWIDRGRPGGAMVVQSISLPLGVVTLSESFGRRLANGAYDDAVRFAGDKLRRTMRRHVPPFDPDDDVQMLGTSGTVTTLAAVHLGLKRYDRRKVDGLSLPFAAISAAAWELRRLDPAERAAHPCIGSARADLVIAGSVILDAIHDNWPIDALKIADRGVREGILNALMGRSLRGALGGADLATPDAA